MTRALTCCFALAALVGCGGAQTPPPCIQTTWLIPEEEVLQRVRYTYDDDQRVVATERLVGAREQTVERVEVSYDDEGRVATEVINGRDEYGRPLEVVVHYTYDDSGQLSSLDWIVGNEVQRGETYTYDGDGRVAEVVYYGRSPENAVERVIRHIYGEDPPTEVVETDVGGNGTVDSRTAYTYDGDGRPLVIESSGGETALARTRFRYDDDGRLLLEEIDSGADGSIDSVRRYVYDEEDEDVLLSQELDEGNDGSVERRIAYVYDEEGRLLSETDLISDRGADPAATRRVTSSRTEYDYSCWER
jgi:hypothetical protein